MGWAKAKMQASFDGTGMAVFHEGNQEAVPCVRIETVFETARLWRLLYDGEKALLQKKDLVPGAAEEFSTSIAHFMGNKRFCQ